jgi:hypothetical protein
MVLFLEVCAPLFRFCCEFVAPFVICLVTEFLSRLSDELKTMLTAMARPKYHTDEALNQFVETSVNDVFARLDSDGNRELSVDGPFVFIEAWSINTIY